MYNIRTGLLPKTLISWREMRQLRDLNRILVKANLEIKYVPTLDCMWLALVTQQLNSNQPMCHISREHDCTLPSQFLPSYQSCSKVFAVHKASLQIPSTWITSRKPTMIDDDGPSNAPEGSPTFKLFDQLPPEIRLQIWEAALPGPRVIGIVERRVKRRDNRTPDTPFWCRDDLLAAMLALWSHSKAPSTLLACKESNQVASKCYVPSFAFAGSISETYFDFHRDTLYLRFDTFLFDDTSNWNHFAEDVESIHDIDHVR